MRGAVPLPEEAPVRGAAARRALGALVTDGVSQDTGTVNGLAAISRRVRTFFRVGLRLLSCPPPPPAGKKEL